MNSSSDAVLEGACAERVSLSPVWVENHKTACVPHQVFALLSKVAVLFNVFINDLEVEVNSLVITFSRLSWEAL